MIVPEFHDALNRSLKIKGYLEQGYIRIKHLPVVLYLRNSAARLQIGKE
jgi:hypothetical protein